MARTTKRSDGLREKKVMIDGKRYSFYGKTEKEILKKIDEKRQELEEKAEITLSKYDKDITFEEYFDRWIENRKNAVLSATIRSHRNFMRRICECKIDHRGQRFGDLKVADIEPEHVRELQRRLEKSGLYSTTINATISEVRSVFKEAINDRIVDFNPAMTVKSLKRREEAARDEVHRALTDDEIHRFFEMAQGAWYYNMFVFMIQTGCRCGEACALMYEDVGDEFVSIKRTITRDEEGGFVIGQGAKTKAGVRDIPLNDEAREALKNQKEMNQRKRVDKSGESDTLYFHNSRGGLASAHLVNETIRVICRDAGIEPFSSHAFRHTFATKAIESGMTPKTLQGILGHSDINMTMNLYSHVMNETKAREMGRLRIKI